LVTESPILGEGLATESSVLREYSSTTLACLKEDYNLKKSQRTADSIANPSPRTGDLPTLLGDSKNLREGLTRNASKLKLPVSSRRSFSSSSRIIF
jgi:hypothetical protein